MVARSSWRMRRAIALLTPLDSEHPLYILYTSGSDRQAEGCLAHDGGLSAWRIADAQMVLRH